MPKKQNKSEWTVAYSLASRLVHARMQELPITDVLPNERPKSIESAYATQEEFISLYGKTVGGWKIAYASIDMQKQYNTGTTYFGPIFEEDIKSSGLQCSVSQFRPFGLECEIAIIMNETVRVHERVEANVSLEQLVSGVVPTIEIVSSRYLHWERCSLPLYIADCASNGGLVSGNAIPVADIGEIAALQARLVIAGLTVAEGCASARLGHPLNALRWLINTKHRSFDLRKGDIISLGSITNLTFAKAGDKVSADFGLLGTLDIDAC